MSAALATLAADPIAEEQRRYATANLPETAEVLFRRARWWELEASRGFGSARYSLWYARNLVEEGWRLIATGDHRATQPPRHVARCAACQGPAEGMWGCGGPAIERVGKFDTRTVCSTTRR